MRLVVGLRGVALKFCGLSMRTRMGVLQEWFARG